jgi:hypothetical protein
MVMYGCVRRRRYDFDRKSLLAYGYVLGCTVVRRRRCNFGRKSLLVYGYVRRCMVVRRRRCGFDRTGLLLYLVYACVRSCTAAQIRFRLKCVSMHRKPACCAAAQRTIKSRAGKGQQTRNLAVGWARSQLSKASRPRAACRLFSSLAAYPRLR